MKTALFFAAAAALVLPFAASAQVVINEFAYDDAGTDDREFIELFNAGAAAEDLSGWVLGAYDQNGTANPTTTLPAGATIQPGGFYVVANSPVLNVDHIVASNYLENDQEVLLLRNAGGVLVDAVAYETNKGIPFVTGSTGAPADSAAVAAQVGPGIFGNHQCSDIAGAPSSSLGRFVDGRDTNNNGRDFGLRVATPGTANTSGGVITEYAVPGPVSETPGTAMANIGYSFVPSRVIDPTVVETNNPNAISPPWGAGSKAWVAWDPSGGGNGVSSGGHFPGTAASFRLRVWLETADLPVQTNTAGTLFRGSETTIYGLGCGDALTNATDLDGAAGWAPGVLPASDTGNGSTGIAWVYERVGTAPAGGPVSEKLYLVDAKDGGDSDFGGNTPLYWTILAVYDLAATAPGWYDLSISIDTSGNGTASFDGQPTAFTTSGLHSSAFHVGYRENLQLGADGTPDALMRPPTFTFAPAVASIADLSFAAPTPGAVNLTIPVAPGQTIGIEYSTSLEAGSWLDLGDVVVAAGTGTFSDTDAGRLAAFRGFYRAFLR